MDSENVCAPWLLNILSDSHLHSRIAPRSASEGGRGSKRFAKKAFPGVREAVFAKPGAHKSFGVPAVAQEEFYCRQAAPPRGR